MAWFPHVLEAGSVVKKTSEYVFGFRFQMYMNCRVVLY